MTSNTSPPWSNTDFESCRYGVNFNLLNNDGSTISQKHEACFSIITYDSISTYSGIEVIIYFNATPFNREYVIKWSNDLNSWGFHNHFHIDERNSCYIFKLDVSNFMSKGHLSSALILIRYLMEVGIVEILKNYFDNSKGVSDYMERFNAFTRSHSQSPPNCYVNTNHTVLNLGNSKYISLPKLLLNFAKSEYKMNSFVSRCTNLITNLWTSF